MSDGISILQKPPALRTLGFARHAMIDEACRRLKDIAWVPIMKDGLDFGVYGTMEGLAWRVREEFRKIESECSPR